MARRRFPAVFLVAIGAVMFGGLVGHVLAGTTEELDRDAGQVLSTLYTRHPPAQMLGKEAHAILVFPNVVKAGLMFGGAFGEGVLMKAGKPAGHYNSVSASWGLQAGLESFAYVVFLMNGKAVDDLASSKGWELGVGPTVVVVNEGIAKNLSTSSLKDNVYAYITDQQGLISGISIEGTKVRLIER